MTIVKDKQGNISVIMFLFPIFSTFRYVGKCLHVP